MRKLAFCSLFLLTLFSDIIFFIYHYCAGVSNKHCLLPFFHFNRLIMGKVEIGNFYCLIGDNRILFLQKCLLNSSPLL